MKTLKTTLTLNAGFSFLSGASLVLASKRIADLFGISNNLPFLLLGIGLLIFSGIVAYEVRKLRTAFTWSIILQDLLWVAGSALLLLWDPFQFSLVGKIVIGGVALIVLDFAIFQFIGLRKYQSAIG